MKEEIEKEIRSAIESEIAFLSPTENYTAKEVEALLKSLERRIIKDINKIN